MGHLTKLLEQAADDDAKVVTFKLTEEQRDHLSDACKNRGLDRSAFIAAAVLDALDQLEQ